MDMLENLLQKYDSGVNLIWKLENFRSKRIYATYFNFKWPFSENIVEISVQRHDESTFCFIISCFIDLTISGTISVVNTDNSLQFLNQFNKLQVSNEENIQYINAPSNILCLNTNEYSDDMLTLSIQLWETSKEKINSSYYISSKGFNQNFHVKWMFEVGNENIYIKQVDEEITRYFGQNYKLTLTALVERFNDPNSFTTRKEDINYLSIHTDATCYMKLKLEAIKDDGSSLPLLNFDWNYVEEQMDINLDLESLQTINSNKSIYFPKGYITIICFIDIEPSISSQANIEKVDFISVNSEPFLFLDSTSICRDRQHEKKSNSETFNESMYKLFEDGYLCDVSLRVSNATINCHKAVLCARSTVFMAMFQNDMQEKQNSIVDIEDIDLPTLSIFIKAFYTDKLENVTWEDALKIYAAADKYDVSALKRQCSDILLSFLSNDNLCALLELCDDYHDIDLKTKLEKFFLSNSKEIINLQDWKYFMRRKPLLAAELLQEAFSQSP